MSDRLTSVNEPQNARNNVHVCRIKSCLDYCNAVPICGDN